MKFKKGKFYKYNYKLDKSGSIEDEYVVVCTEESKKPHSLFTGMIVIPSKDSEAHSNSGYSSKRFLKKVFFEFKQDIKIK